MDTDNSVILPSGTNTNFMTGTYPTRTKSILKQSPTTSFLPFQSTAYNQLPQRNNCCCSYNNSSLMVGQQHIVPGGVTFKFNRNNSCLQTHK